MTKSLNHTQALATVAGSVIEQGPDDRVAGTAFHGLAGGLVTHRR
jgi:hypothetical protein